MRHSVCLFVGLLITPSTVAYTQEAATLVLDGQFSEGLAWISSVRELADGRVFVGDPLGQIVLRLDMAAGTADTVGRVGRGPGEYRQPDGVLPWPGDSTLLVDLGNGRLTVMAPNGSFHRSIPIAAGDPSDGESVSLVLPRFVDSEGRMYFQPFAGFPSATNRSDSAPIIRRARDGARFEAVGVVGLPTLEIQTARGATAARRVPLSPQDDWAVGMDGRVALVRASDYHVEWVGDGPTQSGEPVPLDPIPVGRREKEQWIADLAASNLNVNWNSSGGRTDVTLTRGIRGTGRINVDRFPWPDHMPPFRAGRTHVSPIGESMGRAIGSRRGADDNRRVRSTRAVARFGHASRREANRGVRPQPCVRDACRRIRSRVDRAVSRLLSRLS